MPLPIRKNVLSDMVEPRIMKSNTDNEEPMRVKPYTDSADPMRKNDLKDSVDPHMMKSRTDSDDPIRCIPKTDMLEPSRM
jgi:hypothetical protein